MLTTKHAKLNQENWHDISHGGPQHVLMIHTRDKYGGNHCHLVVQSAVEKLNRHTADNKKQKS